MAFAAGAHVVQYREKRYRPHLHRDDLQALVRLARAPYQKLVVNDLVQEAAFAGADGVHLGAEDTLPEQAASLLPETALIGVTVHSLAELERAELGPADYYGIGPVFGTNSKVTGLPPLGIPGLAALARRTQRPVVAIGNVQPADVAPLLQAGAHGVAVLGGISLAPDPYAATMAYLEEFGRAGVL